MYKFKNMKPLSSGGNDFKESISLTSYLIFIPFLVFITKFPLNFTWFELPWIIVLEVVISVFFSTFSFADKDLKASSIFFPTLDLVKLKTLNDEETKQVVHEMIAFPKRFANSIFFHETLPKTFIVFIFLLIFPNAIEFERELVLLSLLSILTLFYKYSCTLIESHQKIGLMFESISEVITFSKLERCDNTLHRHFPREEMTRFTTLWIVVTISAIFIDIFLVANKSISISDTNGIIMISLCGFVLFLRVMQLCRVLEEQGLKSLLKMIEKSRSDESGVSTFYPSSDPSIMSISVALWEMKTTINNHENSMSDWAIQAVESSRYQGLGEIAGLVCHDIVVPLWLAKLALDEIKQSPEMLAEGAADPKNDGLLANILEQSLQKSLDLVCSLRSYLKASNDDESTSLLEGLEATVSILRTKYKSEDFFKNVHISLPDNLSDLKVHLSKHDIIHIFLNILSNSFDNILEHKIASPKIIFELKNYKEQNNFVQIDISDNGTGLKSQMFESMTSSHSHQSTEHKVSMGLKLVRRLLERKGGLMSVKDINPNGFNTTVSLSFPKAKESEEFLSEVA